MKVAVLLAEGFEELEALTPVDILRRANFEVHTIAIAAREVTGSHGITVVADKVRSEVRPADYDAVIFPGGMPGATNLDASEFSDKMINAVRANGGRLAAICAAPLVLGRRGLLKGKRATCFPGFEGELIGATVTGEDVVTDGNITTASGMPAAYAFALELEKLLKADEHKARDFSNYRLPPIDLLEKCDSNDPASAEDDTHEIGEKLIAALASFEIKAVLLKTERGPRLTKYIIRHDENTSFAYVSRLSDDIALELAAESVSIERYEENGTLAVVLPNKKPRIVSLRELIESDEFTANSSKTAVALGKSVEGSPIFSDISKMPHLLVAGATGMGKSVYIHTLITSILYKARPDEVKFILIDPKMVEFYCYRDIPHLLVPVITEANKAAGALLWTIGEMNRRYDLIEDARAKNIDDYNAKLAANPNKSKFCKPLPKIVIVIDELNDLMMLKKDPIEQCILLLTQKARAAGIHVIVATQRPTADVITGVIKANIPSRIALKVSSVHDSKTILDQSGANKLLGKGDMLFTIMGSPLMRAQVAFISERETDKIVDFINSQEAPDYDEQIIADIELAAADIDKKVGYTDDLDDDDIDFDDNFDDSCDLDCDEKCDDDCDYSILQDPKFIKAVNIAIENGSVSTVLLQRELNIGYGKAAIYIDEMDNLGIIGERNGFNPREVCLTAEEWKEMLGRLT